MSFYNERNGLPIKPSPVIGAIGLGRNLEKVGRVDWTHDVVFF